MIAAIVDELRRTSSPAIRSATIGAAQLLLTAGDNPERLRSEASFASLCGVSPVPASSGKTRSSRHDGSTAAAIATANTSRMHTSSPSDAYAPTREPKDYVARRTAEGHSKLDAIRTLKRYLAREVFTLITQRRKEINATRIAA